MLAGSNRAWGCGGSVFRRPWGPTHSRQDQPAAASHRAGAHSFRLCVCVCVCVWVCVCVCVCVWQMVKGKCTSKHLKWLWPPRWISSCLPPCRCAYMNDVLSWTQHAVMKKEALYEWDVLHRFVHLHIYVFLWVFGYDTHTHKHARMHACTHASSHTQTGTHTHIHTKTYTQTCMHACTHASSHIQTSTHTHMHICTLSHTHTNTYTNTHTHTHSHTHTIYYRTALGCFASKLIIITDPRNKSSRK